MRLAADLSRMFLELPLPARFAAAKAAGFEGVSLASPYDGPVQELRDRLVLAGLSFVAMQAPPPNYTGAVPGYAAAVGGEERFQRDFKRMMRYAEVLKPAVIEILPGPEGDFEVLVQSLRWACAEAPKRVFTIAPRGSGSFLSSYEQAAEGIAAVGAANLGLSLDTGEAVRLGRDALAVWEGFGALVRHLGLAAEPGSDALDVAALLARLEADGFAGWLSADYTPRLTTAAGLHWMPPVVPVAGKKKRK